MSARRDKGAHADKSRARKRALQALYQWEITRQEAGDICRQFVEEQDMQRVDVAYFNVLVRETVADVEALDAALTQHLDREWERLDLMERSVLRIGAFELRHRSDVPYRVAINEAVNLAGEFGTDQSPLYVNAVLDRCARDWRRLEYDAAS